jgi:hypothetical protein
MNKNHEVCGGEEWRTAVRDYIIPWALGDGQLGDDVLEVGPGYGATTDVFRERVARLTRSRSTTPSQPRSRRASRTRTSRSSRATRLR